MLGGFLPVASGFLPPAARGGFLPPTTLSTSPAWTVDGTSGKGVPATGAEWDLVLAQAGISSGGPSALWLMQEASGNAADSIGAFTLTAANTPNYQQTITGWSRKGLVMDDGQLDTFTNASTPNLGTTSQLVLAFVRFPSSIPAANRSVLSIGASGTRDTVQILTTSGKLRGTSAANNADSATSYCDGATHALIIRHNRATSEVDIITEVEKLSPTFSASVTGVGTLFGNAGSAAAACGFLYGASFHGTAAELSDAQIKTLLQVLGFTVAW